MKKLIQTIKNFYGENCKAKKSPLGKLHIFDRGFDCVCFDNSEKGDFETGDKLFEGSFEKIEFEFPKETKKDELYLDFCVDSDCYDCKFGTPKVCDHCDQEIEDQFDCEKSLDNYDQVINVAGMDFTRVYLMKIKRAINLINKSYVLFLNRDKRLLKVEFDGTVWAFLMARARDI